MTTSSNADQPSPVEAVERYSEITDSHWEDLLQLCSHPVLLDILPKKQAQDLLPDSLGFNLFRLISGTYHRENFHSDIIRSFLEPSESHGAGHRHVHAFIDWLRTCRPDLEGLNPRYFQDVKVEREKHGRVDIVISDESSKKPKAIIVENKIYGARDMIRQLPRYLDQLENEEFEVVAIVYLTLNEFKVPDIADWLAAADGKPSDHDRVKALLIPIVAFSHSRPSLLDWIQECERHTTEFDTLAALRQYRQLIQHLGAHAMNDILTKRFYEEITKDTSFLPNARSLVKVMNDLPQYRASRIKSSFESNCRPFTTAAMCGPTRVLFSGNSGHESDYLRVDVHCYEDKSVITIWDWDFENFNMSRVDKVISEASLGGDFARCLQHESLPNISQCWIKILKFPEDESNLDAGITATLKKIADWKSLRRSKPTALLDGTAESPV